MSTQAYSKKQIIQTINTALVGLFVLFAVIMPQDEYNIKIGSLIIVLVLNILPILNLNGYSKAIFLFGFILTSYNIIISIFLTKDIIGNISVGYPGYILLLYPIIKNSNIDFKWIVICALKLLAYLTAAIAILDLLGILVFESNPIVIWLITTGNAMIGRGSHLMLYYMVFIKTSPLLFIGLMYGFKNKKLYYIILFTIAILLSGTRANVFALVIAWALAIFLFYIKTSKARVICIFVIIVMGLLAIQFGLIEKLLDVFARKSTGDETRYGHLVGVIEFWESHPINFIIGSGFTSKFFSYGVNDYVSNIELSYWNLLRQVGIIAFSGMMVMYIYPIKLLLKKKKHKEMVIAYIIYLIIAYTNPFLYSSTGMLITLYMYYLCYLKEKIYEK